MQTPLNTRTLPHLLDMLDMALMNMRDMKTTDHWTPMTTTSTTTNTMMFRLSLPVRMAASTTRIRHNHLLRRCLVCLRVTLESVGHLSPMASSNWTGRGGPFLYPRFVSLFHFITFPS